MCFQNFSFIAINTFNGYPPFSISFNKGRGYNNNALHFIQSLLKTPNGKFFNQSTVAKTFLNY